jgi:predicted transglutaminase-like cysteine proteinase
MTTQRILYLASIIGIALILALSSSCSNNQGPVNEAKVDSLTKTTEEKLKNYEDSINRVINSMNDSDIVNDPGAPAK